MYLYISEQGWASVEGVLDPSLPLVERARRLWDAHIDWALAHPVWNRAVTQLSVTDILTAETRAAETAMFPDVGMLQHVQAGEITAGRPSQYADALFIAVANTTIEFAMRERDKIDAYKASGFLAIRRMFFD
jgi:hypothetical protein